MRPGAVARGAGVGDDLAVAVARRARLLDREEALRHPHLAAAVARRALLGLRSGLGAAAVAGLARLHASGCGSSPRCRAPHPPARARGCSAGRRRDRRRCRARRAARRRSRRRCRRRRRRSRRSPRVRPPRAAARRRIDAGVAELVVGGALPGVGEHLVGFLGLLELLLGALVVRVAVGMVLHRELPVGLLDVLLGSVAIDARAPRSSRALPSILSCLGSDSRSGHRRPPANASGRTGDATISLTQAHARIRPDIPSRGRRTAARAGTSLLVVDLRVLGVDDLLVLLRAVAAARRPRRRRPPAPWPARPRT